MKKRENQSQQKQVHKKNNFGLIFFNKLLFSIILISGFCYTLNINDLAVKGFELQALKQEIKELHETEKTLKLEVADLRSYNNLDDKIKKSNFITVDSIEYLESEEEQLAVAIIASQ